MAELIGTSCCLFLELVDHSHIQCRIHCTEKKHIHVGRNYIMQLLARGWNKRVDKCRQIGNQTVKIVPHCAGNMISGSKKKANTCHDGGQHCGCTSCIIYIYTIWVVTPVLVITSIITYFVGHTCHTFNFNCWLVLFKRERQPQGIHPQKQTFVSGVLPFQKFNLQLPFIPTCSGFATFIPTAKPPCEVDNQIPPN